MQGRHGGVPQRRIDNDLAVANGPMILAVGKWMTSRNVRRIDLGIWVDRKMCGTGASGFFDRSSVCADPPRCKIWEEGRHPPPRFQTATQTYAWHACYLVGNDEQGLRPDCSDLTISYIRGNAKDHRLNFSSLLLQSKLRHLLNH